MRRAYRGRRLPPITSGYRPIRDIEMARVRAKWRRENEEAEAAQEADTGSGGARPASVPAEG